MKRKLTDRLLAWKITSGALPVMLIGARQTGKTYLLKEFCRENYEHNIYLNFDDYEIYRSFFDDSLNPVEIVKKMEIYFNKKIEPSKTIFFFDEIQSCERAVASLKYFAESDTSYRIVTAGSLLGVKLNRFHSSFPVGKVQFEYLYPMDFEEFLWATGEVMLADEIKKCFQTLSSVSQILHLKALQLYKTYLYVGGMPAAINHYLEVNQDIVRFDNTVHQNIITAYLADMVKYANGSTAVKTNEVYKSIPAQLAKENHKFMYKLLASKANKEKYESSIDWLLQAGLLLKSSKISLPQSPLNAYSLLNYFKLYLSDIGLLVSVSKMTVNEIMNEQPSIFKGAITENFVAQSFISKGIDLYYWESGNMAEVDYLLNMEGDIIPVEVKASDNVRSKSLSSYMQKYAPPYAIRISSKNFGYDNNIKSIPLYAIDNIVEKY